MSQLWYYRHDQHIVGPLPQQAIERYLILGRLRMEDEVRTSDSSWLKIVQCPEFSSTCRLILEGDEAELAAAKRFADERSRARRSDARNSSEDQRMRDRREDEPEEIMELRSHRADVFEHSPQRSWMVYVVIAILVALVLLALAFYQPVNPIHVGFLRH